MICGKKKENKYFVPSGFIETIKAGCIFKVLISASISSAKSF